MCASWGGRKTRCAVHGLSKRVLQRGDRRRSALLTHSTHTDPRMKIDLTWGPTNIQTEVAERLREQIFANMEFDIAAQYIPSLGFLVCIAKTEDEVQVPHEWDLTVSTWAWSRRAQLRPV